MCIRDSRCFRGDRWPGVRTDPEAKSVLRIQYWRDTPRPDTSSRACGSSFGPRCSTDVQSGSSPPAAIAGHFEAGWDSEFGGIFRYVDREGARPRGVAGDEPYEALMMDTWDTKIWWPHAEALYATLLGSKVTGDAAFVRCTRSCLNTCFGFPNPDRTVGEWIQIRDRRERRSTSGRATRERPVPYLAGRAADN